ncbi:bifunctional UDP-N-acetylmuramoyl-tripeptide:D-alanyl-D-alanine ligase/alanine racemase [Flavobacterium sp. TP390]|uniref:Alanine racemase n=1 Tax=Flavobacterium profundi TaxID=1774945 RepID=A0A6I4IJN3_9FLAO|nr:bifunctional UDP-N-acetylmuramoyl-tripeptide:D-alanyl-D-alanine ligase/alanine racemase [Flavobacterium profundi]MVO09848.1 bifunctional UDP-N-acetylmuramoyl-tripeptide:D-alanyl-D-alanine ligase/alanine racemase [Flavobacterium profundi]
MTFSIQNIIPHIQAKIAGIADDFIIENISIDSRSLQNNAGTLFFALKGQNHDGHHYIAELIKKGVRFFVVEKVPENYVDKATFLAVQNTTKALQKTAKYYRNLFHFPIIGITGSNGKTIVKEWLNFLLSPDYSIVRNPKSYNSQVGVPLSIFGTNENHNLGIFEAGISQKNEMRNLENIIHPTIGVFTHLGIAHEEGFSSLEEKIVEKTRLFTSCEVVILPRNEVVEKHIKVPTFTWSLTDEKATVFGSIKTQENQKTVIQIHYQNNSFEVTIPFQDSIAVNNAMTCMATLLYLKIDTPIIQERLQKLYPVEIRLQAKKGINGCVLIDDSYSSDYQSLKIALDFLEQQKLHSKKTIILSDIFQGGLPIDKLYQKVALAIQNNNIDRIIVIGETISKYLSELPNVIAFGATIDFLKQFNTQSFQNETILIKGARSFNFDEIVVLLEEKKHETVLEINLDALTHNLNFYKSKLHSNTKIMVMVKAFGYGNGGFEIAKLLEHNSVDYLGVAFADEGIELRKAGITLPIMVLNPENSSFPAMIAYDLEPEIYSITGLQAFLQLTQQKNITSYPIHIKLDTGMHRLGFEANDMDTLISLLRNNNFVMVKSVFSHLSASDDTHFDDFTQLQFERFHLLSQKIINALDIQPIRHILNTSGIFNYAQEMQLEMVRLGIGLYGMGNSKAERNNLQNVSTLKSVISQIREVEEGESIGYSRKFMVNKSMKVATIPIGYADGIRRAWGNEKGYVVIKNQKASILGNICMDMLMVDVTSISCIAGDEVIIFGENPNITEIATVTETIPYEILTGISQRVKRVFYKN